jgi:hypothetical protein
MKKKNLNLLLEEYLKTIGALEEVKLGTPPQAQFQVNYQYNQEFSQKLKKRGKNTQKNTEKIIWLAVISLCILFATSVFFAFYLRDNSQIVTIIFGGAFLGNIRIIEKLRQLWLEKDMIDVLGDAMEQLSPEEGAKLAIITYWKLLHRK